MAKLGEIVEYHFGSGDANVPQNGQPTAPAVVTVAWGDGEHALNLRVFVDGTDVLWRTSVQAGETDPVTVGNADGTATTYKNAWWTPLQ